MPKTGWKVKNPERFIEDLVRGLQTAGDRIHAISQQPGYCPVDKGTLRSSSPGAEYLSNGFRIVYRTSYAARQEFGLPRGHTEHVGKHDVRAFTVKKHSRKTKSGKTIIMPERFVQAHSRGPFDRTFANGYAGRFYLTRAFNETRPQLVEFIKRLSRSS